MLMCGHLPSVLRLDVAQGECRRSFVEVPHRPFEEVFHEAVVEGLTDNQASAFVTGLAELQELRHVGRSRLGGIF